MKNSNKADPLVKPGEHWRIGQGCIVRVLSWDGNRLGSGEQGYACVSLRRGKFHFVRAEQFRKRVA